jgi:hypothetical protein
VPLPSPAPAADRDAADLRAHLQSAGWAADAAVCYRMLKWQRANNLDDVTAARTIGLPHIGHEVFARLRENRKPIGVGAHWPALQELVVQAAAQARFDAMVAVRPDAAPATEPVAATSAPAARPTTRSPSTTTVVAAAAAACPVAPSVAVQTSSPDIVKLARIIESESTRDADNRSTRTRATAQLVAGAMTELKISKWTLARKLASVGGAQPDATTIRRWDQRLRLYERTMGTPTSTLAVSAREAVDACLPALAASITDELGHKGDGNHKRTAATARRIRAGATALATPQQIERSYKRTFAGARSLATQLAHLDANARGQAPDHKLLEAWAWRIDAYLPLIRSLDKATKPAPARPAAAVAAPVEPVASAATSSPTPAPAGSRGSVTVDDERIVGRPVLLADGRLRVTVARTVRVETKISFSDPLWAAAMVAVNANA